MRINSINLSSNLRNHKQSIKNQTTTSFNNNQCDTVSFGNFAGKIKDDSFFLKKLEKMRRKNERLSMVISPQGKTLMINKSLPEHTEANAEGNYILIAGQNESIRLGQIIGFMQSKAAKVFNATDAYFEVITNPKNISEETIKNARKLYGSEPSEDYPLSYIEYDMHKNGAEMQREAIASYAKRIGAKYELFPWEK